MVPWTLAIRNLTGPKGGSHLGTGPQRQTIVSATPDQPTTEMPRPRPSRRLGLSGKLLLLTIPLVMIAEILIYVPAIVNIGTDRLEDRLAVVNAVARVLDEGAGGMAL